MDVVLSSFFIIAMYLISKFSTITLRIVPKYCITILEKFKFQSQYANINLLLFLKKTTQ